MPLAAERRVLYQSGVPRVYVGVLSLSFGVLKLHETMECFRGIFVTAMLKLTSIRWWRFVPQKLKCSWEWCHFLVGEQSDRCTVRALLKWQLACSLCFRLFFGRIVNTFFGHVRFAYSMSKPDMNLPRKWLSDGFLNWISIPVVGSQKYIKVW